MALIRYAEGQQRSGSIGGTTYSHNRFGQYIRARSTPVNPNSTLQQLVRNLMRNLTIAWQTVLTASQRQAWKVYADNVTWKNKFGDDVHLTSLNHYIRTNVAAGLAGVTRVDNAPTIYNLGDAEQSLVVTASEAAQTLDIAYDDTADWCDEDGGAQLFYLGLPQNTGRAFFGGPYKALTTVLGDSVAPPASPDAGVATVFPFAQNNRLWVRSRILRADGRLSEYAETNFLAGA